LQQRFIGRWQGQQGFGLAHALAFAASIDDERKFVIIHLVTNYTATLPCRQAVATNLSDCNSHFNYGIMSAQKPLY
jgi:hypothetical protein